ncbi:nuclear receptor coactivator 5 isoform X2 [Achroia grisella]|uniref:nuclear receptor coactivator 5 isoform X2 n=1 Tax=Achroia grisella TaxID=688607 RepID=UPI0027D1F67D|nr:nuclear receptor coactivator 5 isoform X2 [Achroia grisella]
MADKLTLDRQAMKDRSTSHLRIYVGGIPDNTTVEQIFDHFTTYGKINGIVTNRNFGFVQFEEESSVQDAIAKGNGTTFQGKTLTVRTAQQNSEKRTEVVVVHPEVPPAVALTDSHVPSNDEPSEDPYDSYGNFVGDQGYRDEEYDESYNQTWNDGRGGRGRVLPRGRGRGVRGRPPSFQERSPVPGRGSEWADRGGYERYPPSRPDYSRTLTVSEKNDCEIIVVSKTLTEYAEYIEGRLKRLGIVVDLLFPMEDVPIGKVLGNIASRGCLYAILVMPQNQENRSLTLTILHGLPQEHRNMPLEDALQLISRNFQEVQRGGPSGREAVYALLGQLADGRTLTVLQYDKVIEYLQERKHQQVKIELGEPLTTAPATSKTQVDLQERILSILNDKKMVPQKDTQVTPAPPQPQPKPSLPQTSQNTLLKDPTVRKALDTILKKFA